MATDPVSSSFSIPFKWLTDLFPGWKAKRGYLAIDKAKKKIKLRHLDAKEKQYTDLVSGIIDQIGLSGLHFGDSPFYKLEQIYVNLNIQHLSHHDGVEKTDLDRLGTQARLAEKDLKVEDVVRLTFNDKRQNDALLIDGDAGSGKTTLAAHLFHFCLQKGAEKKLGFSQPVIPIYFPLRDFDPDVSLIKNLENWCKDKEADIRASLFEQWINSNRKKVLLILDGLDEIASFDTRQKTCDKVHDLARRCAVVLTSRRSAMIREVAGNKERLSLDFRYLHARISDFSTEQKQEFLENWFVAMKLDEPRPEKNDKHWDVQQVQAGKEMAGHLLDYLNKKANRNINNLAGVPMILQIMAMVWEMREEVPDNQSELYKAALEYLLEYRDKKGKRAPVPLSAVNGYKVLQPVCLWIQDEIGKDEVLRDELRPMLELQLKKLRKKVTAEDYSQFLVERAWILALFGDSYIFRHKSFREYFAGRELAAKHGTYIDKLVENFNTPWWENALRFYFHKADSEGFKAFIHAFFTSPRSENLSQSDRTYLEELMGEASMCDVQVFSDVLQKEQLNEQQQVAVFDCLHALGSEEALSVLEKCRAAKNLSKNAINRADELLGQQEKTQSERIITQPDGKRQDSFINPIEYNAEYILIPGGEFTTGQTKEKWVAKDRYFARYQVTNKQYRHFIRYLAMEERELNNVLAADVFTNFLVDYAKPIKGFSEYLNGRSGEWHEYLKSAEDSNRDFNSDDQPVVGVTWFQAKVYCLWLSAFDQLERHGSLENLRITYDLPHEYDWEWAAAGEKNDGKMRTYPWSNEKGAPNEKLANFNKNVGKTTPVGRYPDGVTPEGLHDMAGNVCEWQENWHDKYEKLRVFRGSSWLEYIDDKICIFRSGGRPYIRVHFIGFRCTRTF